MVNVTSMCVCACLVLGCSLHSHASGSCYQDAGIEQRGETCAFLHAGHPDFKKGKSTRSYLASVTQILTHEIILIKTCFISL